MNRLPVGRSVGGAFVDVVFERPLPRDHVPAKGTAILPFEAIRAYLSGRPLPKWYRPPGFGQGRWGREPGSRGP
jgi:hypothetical protein